MRGSQATGSKATLLVVNPEAGKGKGRRCFEQLRPELLRHFPGLTIRVTEYPGHAETIGREARRQSFRRILSIGGDGTPYEIINGLLQGKKPPLDIELGMIPAGTGNSFIRDFSPIDPAQVLANIVAGRRQKVDLIEFSQNSRDGRRQRRFFINILGIGLIADILQLTNEKLKFLGAAGYSLAVLVRLARRMRNEIIVRCGNKREVFHDSALVISNSRFTGGKMMIAPQADAGDGQVDLVIFNEVNRRDILAIFRRVFSGRHLDHRQVLTRRASEVTITSTPPLQLMADGELLGKTPLRLKVWPRALTALL